MYYMRLYIIVVTRRFPFRYRSNNINVNFGPVKFDHDQIVVTTDTENVHIIHVGVIPE